MDEHEYSVLVEGMKLAKAYLWRQYWKLKWIMMIVVGLMSVFTIETKQWVPFLSLDMFTMTIMFISIVILRIQMNKLFAIHVKHQREDTETPEDTYSEIQQCSWATMIITWILMYWIVILLFVGTTVVGT